MNKGQQAEQWACDYLTQQGLTLITKNYHCRRGEIDLIMQDEHSLVFVEVRYRKSARFGHALESVNHTKQTKIIITAEHYLLNHKSSYLSYRFDVVAITPDKNSLQYLWVKDAFQLTK